MQNNSSNLRKAAVLIRSLDSATAAGLLAQLPPADAAAVRAACESLGAVDPDEQADVAAEMRRVTPVVGQAAGVELSISSATDHAINPTQPADLYTSCNVAGSAKALGGSPLASTRFEFLEHAPITSLVPYLSREHLQTIAVVLSYLSPSRAAAVLAALPPRQQVDTLERLSALGETDPDSVKVVEQELAAWVSAQSSQRRGARSAGAAQAILAAANATTRESIVANLKSHKSHLAAQLGAEAASQRAPSADLRRPAQVENTISSQRHSTQLDALRATRAAGSDLSTNVKVAPRPRAPVAQPAAPSRLRLAFDDLVNLDDRALATVLHDVDANVLVLALVGSSDDLVERITRQMPKRTAKAFRRQLRQLGPTRLSDVEAAQQVVARAAAQRITRKTAAVA